MQFAEYLLAQWHRVAVAVVYDSAAKVMDPSMVKDLAKRRRCQPFNDRAGIFKVWRDEEKGMCVRFQDGYDPESQRWRSAPPRDGRAAPPGGQIKEAGKGVVMRLQNGGPDTSPRDARTRATAAGRDDRGSGRLPSAPPRLSPRLPPASSRPPLVLRLPPGGWDWAPWNGDHLAPEEAFVAFAQHLLDQRGTVEVMVVYDTASHYMGERVVDKVRQRRVEPFNARPRIFNAFKDERRGVMVVELRNPRRGGRSPKGGPDRPPSDPWVPGAAAGSDLGGALCERTRRVAIDVLEKTSSKCMHAAPFWKEILQRVSPEDQAALRGKMKPFLSSVIEYIQLKREGHNDTGNERVILRDPRHVANVKKASHRYPRVPKATIIDLLVKRLCVDCYAESEAMVPWTPQHMKKHHAANWQG